MAIKKICDVCGAEINPSSSGKVMSFGKFGACPESYDLCVSCAFHLQRWIHGKEKMVDAEEGI